MLITRHCQQSSDDLFTCERVMLRFLSGKCEPRGLDFNVWDYSMPEIYGIILGMFTKLGLVECLGISESDLLDFIIDVDKGYHATYYHSFYHAADVTAVLYRILFDMNASQYLTKPDMATLLLAGLCHDIGHPGLNNLFQVNAKTELYERYGEASVLEKYSCSLAMELVAKHKLFRNIASSPDAILPEGNHPTEDGMKDAMIKAIMATDMSFHYDMLNNLNTLIEVISTPLSSPSISDNEPTEAESGPDTSLQSSPTQSSFSCNCTALSSPTVYKIPSLCSRFSSCPVAQQPSHIHHHDHHRRQSSISSTSSISSSDSGCSEESTQTTHSLDMGRPSFNLTPELRQSLCNCLLHAADISNAVKPWGLCKRWSDMIVQEFFRQGDIEKARNLPISPNMDRNQHNQAQISLGFADFVVRPYFESLAAFLPDAAPFLTTLASNRAQWLLQKEALEAAKDMSMNTCVATVAETHETNGISSPIQPHLTTGRRVSVAAGVLVLDDAGTHRPIHHKRLRYMDRSHRHHSLRKIKRSLSGKSLSCLRDLQDHSRFTESNNNGTMNQDAVINALKREVALAGKDATVNLPSACSSNNTAITPINISKGCDSGDKDEKVLLEASEQQLQLKDSEQTVPVSCSSHLDPKSPFRQRRYGSLQLEEKHTSIREEYGDGYVILNYLDSSSDRAWALCDNDGANANLRPLNRLHTSSSIPGEWPDPPPTSPPLLLHPSLYHPSQAPTAANDPTFNSNQPANQQYHLDHISMRSNTPAIFPGNIFYGRCQEIYRPGGPLDIARGCLDSTSSPLPPSPKLSLSEANH